MSGNVRRNHLILSTPTHARANTKEWGTYIFNYGRYEVDEYLTSKRFLLCSTNTTSTIGVDAVASLIYLDYARKDGEWVANDLRRKRNIEAINFFEKTKREIYSALSGCDDHCRGIDSLASGIASNLPRWFRIPSKMDMGWMHDILEYMALEPIHRKYHQTKLTFRGSMLLGKLRPASVARRGRIR